MSKQFHLYANVLIAEDQAPELRKATKAASRAIIAQGAWTEPDDARVRMRDEGDKVRVYVDIHGAKLADVAGARAAMIALAEGAKMLGGEVYSLGVAHGHVDENLFDERPDLQTRPADVPAPKPVSVQLAEATAEITTARTEAAIAKAESSDVKAQLARVRARRDELQAKVAELTAERDAAREGRAAAQDALTLAQAQIATLTDERNALKTSLDAMIAKYEPQDPPTDGQV